MDPRMNSTHSIHALPRPVKTTSKYILEKPGEFQRLLATELKQNQSLIISKHAKKRMDARGIHINDEKWNLIHKKVVEAKKKGVNDSLVITQDAALVVSAKNDTVITVLDRKEAQSQIFTNINGTILID